MFGKAVLLLVREISKIAKRNNIKIISCESCTAGLISGALTAESGSSNIFEFGLIVYSDESKTKLLNIDPKLIEKHTAVSKEVCSAMLEQGIIKSNNPKNTICVSTTGYADYFNDCEKCGNVFIGSAFNGHVKIVNKSYNLGRDKNRLCILKDALIMILEILETN